MSAISIPKTLAPLVLGLAAAGCAHQSADRVEADFGSSQRALLNGQFFDPEAARNPSTEAPTGMDGAKAEQVLEAYRQDNADRQPVSEPIRMEISTGRSGR